MANTTHQLESIHSVETALDGTKTRYSFFEPDRAVLRSLMDELFVNHWSQIIVGPCVDGAIFEIQFEKAPAVRYSDGGYLTVDLGKWHFHLALYVGSSPSSSSEELARKRPVAKAALFDIRRPGGGRSWGLRFWNGFDAQMTTIFLPSARLSDDMKVLKTPDWSRLDLYYRLRHRLLAEAIPADYEAAANETWPEEDSTLV